MSLPDITPERMFKPKLEYVGKLLGRDLYADVRNERERALIQRVLEGAINRMDEADGTKPSK